jgi:hypothetical protein
MLHALPKRTGLFISPSGISELDCATTKTDTAERSISICRETLQAAKRTGSHSAGIHVPFTNCFVCRWFCVVHDLKPPLHSHNWLSFGKFQDTERFLIHCERHFLSRLLSSGGTWKYAKASSTKKNLERFSTYWYAPFCCVCLGCCAVEFGNPGGTYE